VDTGGVCPGGALTAPTGPSDNPTRKITESLETLLTPTIKKKPSVMTLFIKDNGRFGTDMTDTEHNPVFPYEDFQLIGKTRLG
jgi:hypothetical protein